MAGREFPSNSQVAALYQSIFPINQDQRVLVIEDQTGVLTIRLQYANGIIDDFQDITIDLNHASISGFWRGHLLEYFAGKWFDSSSGILVPRPVVDGIWVERLYVALFGYSVTENWS